MSTVGKRRARKATRPFESKLMMLAECHQADLFTRSLPEQRLHMIRGQ